MFVSLVSGDRSVSTSVALPSVEREVSGWGRFPVERNRVYRPERWRELIELVRSRPDTSVIARGLGRSYGDAALNGGGAVALQERFNRMLAFDQTTGIVRCEPGVTFADLLETFVPRGYFPPVTPGTKYVTLGGAVACDVHGKNHHQDGTIGAFIETIDLLTADGGVRRCSRSQHPDLFYATLGGMGLTGIITAVELRLRRIASPWMRVETRQTRNLEETLAALVDADTRFRYTVAWIDGLARGNRLGRGVVMGGEHAAADASITKAVVRPGPRLSVPFVLPWSAVRRSSVAILNRLYPALHRDGERWIDYERFFYPLDRIRHWNRLYGPNGFVQYQVALPAKGSERTLHQLLETIAAGGHPSFLSVLKRFGSGTESPLSFPIEGYTLALDLPYSDTLAGLLTTLDELVVRAGGRVYLAKDALLDADRFTAMYPQHGSFLETKARYDPKHRFSSSLARRVGLVMT